MFNKNLMIYLNVANMPIAATSIRMKVSQRNIFDSQPLRCSPIIFLFDETTAMIAMSGTATTPFKTAVTISALIGSMPTKLIKSPMSVATVITP